MATAVIFDMDGTLFQTDTILETALSDTFLQLRSLDKWHTAAPLARYREIMGVPLKEVWETLLPDHSEEDRMYTDKYFLQRLIETIQSGKGALYPNVAETLRALKESGCMLFIASNGLPAYLEAIIRHYDLDTWVSATFSIQQIGSLNKSDLVHLIAETYQVTDGAVVGDRLSDIRAARDNGLTAVGCRFGFGQPHEFEDADYTIDDLAELRELLV